jgi:formylglycine-generating enzyme required for sulfatase activity
VRALLGLVVFIFLLAGATAWGQAPSRLRNGDVFRDCPDCPEMVVIPAGRFMMGSPEEETERDDDESPQRRVNIGRFAIGRYEVTFDQWAACVSRGGCASNPNPSDQGWGRGNRPAINVSWHDA